MYPTSTPTPLHHHPRTLHHHPLTLQHHQTSSHRANAVAGSCDFPVVLYFYAYTNTHGPYTNNHRPYSDTHTPTSPPTDPTSTPTPLHQHPHHYITTHRPYINTYTPTSPPKICALRNCGTFEPTWVFLTKKVFSVMDNEITITQYFIM